MTTKRNLYIEQGTDWSETFYLVSRSGKVVTTTRLRTGESPLDVTSYSIEGHARENADADADLTFAFVFTKDEDANTFTASVDDATTSALEVGLYADDGASQFQYDYLATLPSGNKSRIQEGRLTIPPAVTRPDATATSLDFSDGMNSQYIALLLEDI